MPKCTLLLYFYTCGTCFGSAKFFRLKTIVASFLHLMVLFNYTILLKLFNKFSLSTFLYKVYESKFTHWVSVNAFPCIQSFCKVARMLISKSLPLSVIMQPPGNNNNGHFWFKQSVDICQVNDVPKKSFIGKFFFSAVSEPLNSII